MNQRGRIFISHSHLDRQIADALQRLLHDAGVEPRRIFYSSDPGAGIDGGTNFVDGIGAALRDSELVIPVITQHFLGSSFCSYELGAIWGGRLKTFPLLVPPVEHAELSGVLTGLHVDRIDEPTTLDKLLDALPVHESSRCSTASWGRARAAFLTAIEPALARLRHERVAHVFEGATFFPEGLPPAISAAVRELYSELTVYKRDQRYALDVLDVGTEHVTARLELSYTLVSLSQKVQVTPLAFTPSRPARNYRGEIGGAEFDADHPDVQTGRGLTVSARVQPEVPVPIRFSADVTWNLPDSNHFSTYMPSTDFELALTYPDRELEFTVVPLAPHMVPPRRSPGREVHRLEGPALPYQGYLAFWKAIGR